MRIVGLMEEASAYDLKRVHGKAEVVNGKLFLMSPAIGSHATAALNVATSLKLHQRAGGQGKAFGDNVGFVASPSRTFAPDAAWHVGPWADSGFLTGAPEFAVEVRRPGDYGPTAERELAWKRADYFAAGTKVVWDVDVLREGLIRVYRADDPEHPVTYRRGEIAEAEPAVPGWRFRVNELWDD